MLSEKIRFRGFEGLRVFAIAMVVACHVGALQDTAGGIGNKIFFVLSGFLAYFSTQNIKDVRSLLQFYAKKLIRIVPTYWLVILFAWRMFPGIFVFRDFSTDRSLILNLFFVKTYGHLWFMQQIMLMYLCVPLLHLLVKWIKELFEKFLNKTISNVLCAGIIIILAFLEKNYFTSEVLTLSGEGSHAQFQVWMFMFGFATACIYEAWISGDFNKKTGKGRAAFNIFTDIYVLCFMLALFFFVIPSCHAKYAYIAGIMDSEMLRTVLSCLTVLLLAVTKETVISKVLSCTVFRVLSDISFGIYMVHFFFLGSFLTEFRIQNFISNFLISTCVAYFIYVFCEKPLVGKLRSAWLGHGDEAHQQSVRIKERI